MAWEDLARLQHVRWEQRDQILGCPQEVLFQLLKSPVFPAWLLHEVLHDERASIRLEVARHPQVRADTLARLAQDPTPEVRLQVARARATPPSVLDELSHDPNAAVRAAVATHPRLAGEEILRRLASDSKAEVRQGVVEAVCFPARSSLLEKLVDDPEASVRKAVAGNRFTSPAQLRQLAQDHDFRVRGQVAIRPYVPWQLLEQLSWDECAEVAESARLQLDLARQALPQAEGEDLWLRLLAAFGPPRQLKRWSDRAEGTLICIESFRDGYGGGEVRFRCAFPGDLEPATDPLWSYVVVAFPIEISVDRLNRNPWERLSEIPGLPTF